MSERLKFQGRLAEKEIEGKRLVLRINGLRDSLRNLLDPFEDVAELRGELIAQQAVELAGMQADLDGVSAEIAAIKKALGR